MSSQPPSPIEIEFAERYDREHARVCGDTRPPGLVRRLETWRTQRMVRRALKVAGEPGLILDLSCGSGRFWPVLAEHSNRVILASDNSQERLDHARTHHSSLLLKRIKTFECSAFSIRLPANAVDCIFCMTLFRHVLSTEHRLALLQEFHRVSRDTVIISVSSASTAKATGLTQGKAGLGEPAAAGLRSQVESEFRQAGFQVLKYQEFLPGSALWRIYVLRKVG